MPDQIADHVARGLARLATQYRDTVTQAGVVRALGTQVQALENAFGAIPGSLSLDGEGAQLDRIGKLIGVAREGQDDDAYRMRLRAQVLVNRSSGEIETLVQIARLTVPECGRAALQEFQPAAFELLVDTTRIDDDRAARVAAIVREARGGGIRSVLTYHAADPELALRFVDMGEDKPFNGHGFADASNADPESAGFMLGAI